MFVVIRSTNMRRRKLVMPPVGKFLINSRNGVTNGIIYHLFDCSVRTIQNIRRWYRESQFTNKRSKPSRQRATTAREGRRLILRSRQLLFSSQ